MAENKPIRILIVVIDLHMGGGQYSVMQILRCINKSKFKIDFLVHSNRDGCFSEEARSLGAKIFYCPKKSLRYPRRLKAILKEHGPYSVVHSNVHVFSGYILKLAHNAGVPIRIAHSRERYRGKKGFFRKFYLHLMRSWISNYATHKLAINTATAAALYGRNWENDPKCNIFPMWVDFKPFHEKVDRTLVRQELGIPIDAFCVGHVGRFEEEKNHQFLIEIAAEVSKKNIKLHLLLVGDGPLRSLVEKRLRELGLSDKVTFTGIRFDVSRLMLGAMDVFVLPSLTEGLSRVLIEAQAAGIPCVYSDVIPKNVDVVQPLLQRLSLSIPSSKWAEAVLAAPAKANGISQLDALEIMEKQPYNFEIQVLEKLYSGQLPN